MKRLLAFGLSLGLVAVMAVPAMAKVERNQINYGDYTISVNNGAYIHLFDLEIACGIVTGSGTVKGLPSYTQTITGTFSGGQITFTSVYTGTNAGYTWSGVFDANFPGLVDVTSGPGVNNAEVTVAVVTASDYANHGEWVVENGGGDDAARSCIGMPVQAQS
jgi:hypothetical protein